MCVCEQKKKQFKKKLRSYELGTKADKKITEIFKAELAGTWDYTC